MDASGIDTQLCLQSSKERSFQSQKCIICQKDSTLPLTTSENGCRKIIEASEVCRDIIHERLELDEGDFKYHMSNECYKQYTLKKTIDALKIQSECRTPAESEVKDDAAAIPAKRSR